MDLDSVKTGVIRERTEVLVEVSRSCIEKVYVEVYLPENICAVNQVIFTTVSHDQGFSNDEELYGGTYNCSSTWFTAAVITPGGHDRVPRRIIQYNVHARAQFRKHNVCWTVDSDDASIREWVRSIRGGDTIQIIPKAQYPAWINFVQEAEIEVHYTNDSPLASELELVEPVISIYAPVLQNRTCYRSLNKDAQEIRLIHLNPGAFDQPISCSLDYTSLFETPTVNYEALSYCWGSARNRGDISLTVSGPEGPSKYILSVTAALHLAMKSLRPETGRARLLWIDSICINQDDLDERSSQVTLMTNIYHNANRTIVWLGEGDEITQRSIRAIKTISERCEQITTPNLGEGDLVRIHDPLMEGYNVSSFIDEWPLFEAPWFRRTWVVQEVFNAREATVCCGKDVLSWQMVLRVNKCIGLAGMKANSAHKALMPPIYEYLFQSRDSTDIKWSSEAGILEVLVKGLDLDATDPRDKIFAMLQFGTETKDLSLLALDLVPDYRKPTLEVFSTFTKWWIVKHRSLRILSAIQALEGRTWHANFWSKTSEPKAQHPTWSWWHRGHSNWAIGILGLSINCPYRAAADTKPDIDMIMNCGDSSSLPLIGIKVGTIEKVMPYPYYKPPSNHESLHRAYIGIFDPLNLTGKCGSQLGSKYNDTYVSVDDPSLMQSHFNSHFDFSRRTWGVECHGNCFFNTKEGLTGLCPVSAMPGDLIVVLYGGPVPYVLRECNSAVGDGLDRGGKYEFVGECYLQGYMDGRIIEEQAENGLSTKVFVLV